jgi:hypothetical protein
MKTYKSNEEINKDIVDGVLSVDDDITIDFQDCKIEASIQCGNITALDIDALNITTRDIDARNIDAWEIKARDIKARDIKALNITTRDIDAGEIKARDIDARNIDAWDIKSLKIDALNITYFSFCIAYESFKCRTTKGTRKNAKHFCLDSAIYYYRKKPDQQVVKLFAL